MSNKIKPPFPGRKIIAFCGPKGSGKDAAAARLFARASLIGRHNPISGNLMFYQINFADKLRQICCEMFNVPLIIFTDPATKETPHPALYGHTPRYVQQHIAQVSRDMFSKTIWANRWQNQVSKAINVDFIVCTDLRYPKEELPAIRKSSNLIIYIERPEIEAARRKAYEFPGDQNNLWNHESESYYDVLRGAAHFIIKNSGSLNDLYAQVDVVFNLWTKANYDLS